MVTLYNFPRNKYRAPMSNIREVSRWSVLFGDFAIGGNSLPRCPMYISSLECVP